MTTQLAPHDTSLDIALDIEPAPATTRPHGLAIEVDAVTRRVRERGRGTTTLLDAVTLRIEPGELVAIVGPSGAGKSTLLEAIAGVSPISDGAVRFDGVDVHANGGQFRGVIGYVPQDDTIHPELPVRHSL